MCIAGIGLPVLGKVIVQGQLTLGPADTELVGYAARSFIYLSSGWTVGKYAPGQNNLRHRNILRISSLQIISGF